MDSVSKKPIIGGIILAAIIGVVFVGAQINPDNPENEEVNFHVTLADPTLYEPNNGRYSDYFMLEEEGWYEFRFVASGDSPHILSIGLWQKDGSSSIGHDSSGVAFVWLQDNLIFEESFVLQKTLVETETSSWYTWDYSGEKRFYFDPNRSRTVEGTTLESAAEIRFVIVPSVTTYGPVSVDLIKLR
jgi:hypothetical protein